MEGSSRNSLFGCGQTKGKNENKSWSKANPRERKNGEDKMIIKAEELSKETCIRYIRFNRTEDEFGKEAKWLSG